MPDDHSACSETPCLSCEADRRLDAGDKEVVAFFARVRDQYVDCAPFGVEGGGRLWRPRLEGWLAACELYDVPRERRGELVDLARDLFEAVEGRIAVRGLASLDPAELAAPPFPE